MHAAEDPDGCALHDRSRLNQVSEIPHTQLRPPGIVAHKIDGTSHPLDPYSSRGEGWKISLGAGGIHDRFLMYHQGSLLPRREYRILFRAK